MTKVIQINKILFAIHNLSPNNSGVLKKILSDEVSRRKLKQEPNSYTNDNFLTCVKLGLIKENDGFYFLTEFGTHFLLLLDRKDKNLFLDPNQTQKNLLLDIIQEKPDFTNTFECMLDHFRIDFGKKNVWFLPSHLSKEWPTDITELLLDLGFMIQNENRVEISSRYSPFVSRIRNKAKVSQEELLQILENQKTTGNLAEELTIESEKIRLIKDGFPDLALAIQHVSKIDVFAGYDILSYNGNNSNYQPDRFIEVKSTTSSIPRFFWSDNEMNKAKEMRECYWIYLWTNIKQDIERKLIKIKNPYQKLYENAINKPIPVTFFVEVDQMEIGFEI